MTGGGKTWCRQDSNTPSAKVWFRNFTNAGILVGHGHIPDAVEGVKDPATPLTAAVSIFWPPDTVMENVEPSPL